MSRLEPAVVEPEAYPSWGFFFKKGNMKLHTEP